MGSAACGFFLSDPDLALVTLASIGIWEMVGFNMVLFLAGLSTIRRELYQAAAIDGAERGFDRFRLVPRRRPVVRAPDETLARLQAPNGAAPRRPSAVA